MACPNLRREADAGSLLLYSQLVLDAHHQQNLGSFDLAFGAQGFVELGQSLRLIGRVLLQGCGESLHCVQKLELEFRKPRLRLQYFGTHEVFLDYEEGGGWRRCLHQKNRITTAATIRTAMLKR